MMKRTKKGFTLVELIICCAIMTMLAGACTALLMSGEKLFSTGSKSALTQMDVNLLQTTMLNRLPSANSVELVLGEIPEEQATPGQGEEKITELFFDEVDGKQVFTIRHDGKGTTIPEIEEFTCYLMPIGASTTARAQLNYTATCKNGDVYSGGMALSTMNFANATADPDFPAALTSADTPLSLTAPAEGQTGYLRFYFTAAATEQNGAGE